MYSTYLTASNRVNLHYFGQSQLWKVGRGDRAVLSQWVLRFQEQFFFQGSLVGDVKIMWMVTVVQPLSAVKLH